MHSVFCDLHIHTGSALGRPVKITAAAALTAEAAIMEAWSRKGLGVLGLADATAGPVLEVLSRMVERGALDAVPGGGYRPSSQLSNGSAGPAWSAGPLLVPASEIELLIRGRPVHVLALLPDLAAVSALRSYLAGRVRNPSLGCQRAHDTTLGEVAERVRAVGGLFGLAHAFTPHRGFYGSTASTLSEVLGLVASRTLDFVEMGLSADTRMADLIAELRDVPLIACSDAHSCGAIAREATAVRIASASYAELAAAIRGEEGRAIEATYGFDPRLGKYHRTACRRCGWVAGGPEERCPRCGDSGDVVFGVLDRILAIAGAEKGATKQSLPQRPLYRHHVPLRFLPGVGPRTYESLVRACGSELAAMHTAPYDLLAAAAGPRVADTIMAAREGRLVLDSGGGGRFGRVLHISSRQAE